ncbi:type VII secretion protein EccE [Mycobacterium lepromatosis]|uniref:ESX component EccE1 n=1 Tax=Mycobacterium lepromatosis TaxID=480418 RepID=A0A0F4ESX9_9MYCO|nr:type VII secretion protein EccE [Mycobacterium lepromatosis]KJX75908.1 ESX component EccE1 [Mycobacterium lepromatosis]UKN41450.1 type VII secretion protein EccE [Mycobacterium lepromatosis]
MRNPIWLRFSVGRALLVAALAPTYIILFFRTQYWWAGIALVVLVVILTLVQFSGRWLSGWLMALYSFSRRSRKPLDTPSESVIGATVKPADQVAMRWQNGFLVSVIELIPRPFTPTVIVDGEAQTDDLLETQLLEHLLSVHCPDLEAVVVSAGYRVGHAASPDVVNLYQQVIGADPAPAYRRTWVMLRADPVRTRKSAQRRDAGAAGLARYLIASTTRIADQLASHGVDAVCGQSFDRVDHATDVGFVQEKWSMIQGRDAYSVAYTAPAGPDAWWSARADHTITRVRVAPGKIPQATVVLTTRGEPKTPCGFYRLRGAQQPALLGQSFVAYQHCQLPIGSAGVLVGETVNRCAVYMPFDDVDVSVSLGDVQTFTQFVVRAAAAGGIVTLGQQFEKFARLIGGHIGPVAKVAWPNAITYLGPYPGSERVILKQDTIGTPRHRKLPIRQISPPEESHYQMALPKNSDKL